LLRFTLVTPEREILKDTEIEEIIVPGFRGELSILPGHAPLMTTLSTGALRYRLKGENKVNFVAISWGYCNVHPGQVSILAETAERPEEIDLERTKETRKKAEAQIQKGDLDPTQVKKLSSKIQRSLVREEVAGHKSK